MIRILLCALILCNYIIAFSQNIERENVDINYILLPLKKLPDSPETYFVSFTPVKTRNSNSFFQNAQDVELNGYYRLPTIQDADIIINASLTKELSIDNINVVKTEEKYQKDKDSPELKYIAYVYKITYTAPQIFYNIKTAKGVTIEEENLGGAQQSHTFGSTSYKSHYSSESQLIMAWKESAEELKNSWELNYFKTYYHEFKNKCIEYCLMPEKNSFRVRYVKEKKTNEYEDLLQAKDLFVKGVAYIGTDRVALINKVIQPNYNDRVEVINTAISIWEKALLESDLKNKKARIDQKVTRHIYYNLALAYSLINNFEKAQQYLQGREDEETNKVALKNTFAGIESLGQFIDRNKKGMESNAWRPRLLIDEQPYVYKDPATRQKEKELAMQATIARQKAVSDSLSALKKSLKSNPKKPVKKKVGAKKH